MEQRTQRLFTVQEYVRMGEEQILGPDERTELLGGVIVAMASAGPTHICVVNRLNVRLLPALIDRAIVSIQNPLQLDDWSLPEPDVVVMAWRTDFYRDAYAQPSDVLLVIEVCDSSGALDRRAKLPRYAQAGLAEVWLVDIQARRVEVYRRPSGSGYDVVWMVAPGETVAPEAFDDLMVDVAALVG